MYNNNNHPMIDQLLSNVSYDRQRFVEQVAALAVPRTCIRNRAQATSTGGG